MNTCYKCGHKAHPADDCTERILDGAGDVDLCPCRVDSMPIKKRAVSALLNKSTKQMIHPTREAALLAVRTLISYIGDDPDRPGLKKTPERVIKAWEDDYGVGYNKNYIEQQTKSILGAKFKDGAENYDQLITVRKIHFASHCEHHIANFEGEVSIGYIPSKASPFILGLSKLVRVVNMYSKRLQVQERLTNQIADFIQDHVKPLGVGVIVTARHDCMCNRGVKQQGDIDAVTSALRGEMMTKPEVRAEFLKIVGR